MTGDIGEQATCTTCTFSEDFSNYWTASMYFKHPNGSYKAVPIMQNTALPNGINGGMTVYYTQQDFFNNGNQKITAFPPGFRMVIGNPTANGRQSAGLKFVCLNDKGTRFPELDTFPTSPCRAGIMTVHHFPACWDGKTLDPPDHQSHMYDTVRGAFQNGGPCPASHPVRVPQVAYETLWDTTQFNNMWPSDGSNPFVMSYDDDRGYGTHADYVFGWKGDSLQRAMDSNCMFNACENGRPLKSQSVQQMNACRIPDMVGEDIGANGWISRLPGSGQQENPNPPVVVPPTQPTNPPVVNPPAPGGTVPRFGQCGGQGYTGPTQCVAPYTCQVTNQWYSQCL
ncbi:hypothetical protein CC1G_10434 [Coprinopsis cinerea okayama7|uniref:CBM1 domain-containing protein n=1 Tax=Coprinopsis cinerea (strain Okayama-7 / 130 / ATCC MYA-4618 / FGSC 9003) TaxID=240176 RepID=A8PDR5_COPC7|nr:hypothetical protein CC1G_10434 [Coprinopsis cinerea okayama7\|eukprot:XP_001840648.2 hypothetical protein CC1G_10434 [Coprinopsis cinerea okayama7\